MITASVSLKIPDSFHSVSLYLHNVLKILKNRNGNKDNGLGFEYQRAFNCFTPSAGLDGVPDWVEQAEAGEVDEYL